MICHVSFGTVQTTVPVDWLKTVPYYTCILSRMAEHEEVVSVHLAKIAQTVFFEKVTYKFLAATIGERTLLSKTLEFVRSLNPEVVVLHGFHSSLSTYRFAAEM